MLSLPDDPPPSDGSLTAASSPYFPDKEYAFPNQIRCAPDAPCLKCPQIFARLVDACDGGKVNRDSLLSNKCPHPI